MITEKQLLYVTISKNKYEMNEQRKIHLTLGIHYFGSEYIVMVTWVHLTHRSIAFSSITRGNDDFMHRVLENIFRCGSSDNIIIC